MSLLTSSLPATDAATRLRPAPQDEEKAATERQQQPSAPATFGPPRRHRLHVSDPALARTIKAEGGTLIGDYGSFAVYDFVTADPVVLAKTEGVEVRDDETFIMLNAGAVDTDSMPTGASTKGAADAPSGPRMHLLQFAGPIKPSWYAALGKTGAEVVDYIPNNAYLVYGDDEQIAAVQALAAKSFVRWEGPYLDDYRVDPAIRNAFEGRTEAHNKVEGGGLYAVQLFKSAQNAETLSALHALALAPERDRAEVLGKFVDIVVALPDRAIDALARRPDVVSIQPWVEPKKNDERQDQVVAGNLTSGVPNPGNYLSYLAGKGFTQAQFASSNFLVDLTDSGIDNGTQTPNHFALYTGGDPTSAANSRIVYNRLVGTPNSGSTTQGCDGHGNLNSHIIGGFVPDSLATGFPHSDAAGFRYDLGVCPFVKIGSSVIFDPNTFTNPNYENLQSQAYNNGARISSNSWGSSSNLYSSDSQRYDALVRDAQPSASTFPAAGNQEMVILFAAGNDGSGANTVGTPGTGKNVITVGASEGVQAFGAADQCGTTDTEANNANDVVGFSSRGPTSDGRKKPDIMAPGTHISGGVGQMSIASPTGSGNGSALSCFTAGGVCAGPGTNNFWPVGQAWYTASSGTSHSTPAVAGLAALVRQHFINQGLTVPSPAMTKAALMNSAAYMTGSGANDSLYSNNQGMGQANLNNYFDMIAGSHILRDQLAADLFTATGQQRVFTGTVTDSTKPFRVTLAWTDAPGSTTGNAFVNNLDLEVTIGGQTYKGNVFTGASSVTGGAADTRDNVESVFLPAGVTGNFIVRVKATNVAGDGVPGNASALDQDFALVVNNGTAAPLPVINAAGATVTAEGFTPANNAPDPGETVRVNLGLVNVGTAATSNLVATLLPTGGVTSPSGPQVYGALPADGTTTVAKPFTFTASGSCGGTVTLTLQLQDGATDVGTATYTMTLGVSQTQSFSNATAMAVPATGTGASTGAPANPYPSTITVNGAPTSITKVTVTLSNVTHPFSADFDVLLVAPGGQNLILMSDVGGNNSLAGVTYTFDDAAAAAMGTGVNASGTYKPTNSGATDPFPSPAPASRNSPAPAGTATLASIFNGTNANGTWSLYVVDDLSVGVGSIGSWSITFPQPTVCSSTPCAAPVVTTNPSNSAANVCVGTNVNFTAAATGSPTPTVQWQESTDGGANFSNIVGNATATTTTLTVAAVAGSPNRQYRAVFTSGTCITSTATTAATLFVDGVAPAMGACPGNVTVVETFPGGANVTYSTPGAVDTCSGNVTVVCSPPSGAVFPTGTTPVTCSATDSAGNSAQCGFFVTVNAPACTPAGIPAPASQTVCLAATATFTASPTGTGPFTYQWRRGTTNLTNGTKYGGVTSATLTVADAGPADAGNDYNVVVTGSCGGPATSGNATLTINPNGCFDSTFAAGSNPTRDWTNDVASRGAWALDGTGNYATATASSSGLSSISHVGNYGSFDYRVDWVRTGTCATCPTSLYIRGVPQPVQPPYQRWFSCYQFSVTADGRYSVWLYNGTGAAVAVQAWTPLVGVTVNTAPAANWLQVSIDPAAPTMMHFVVNGVEVAAVPTNGVLTSGQVGVSMMRNTTVPGGLSEVLKVDRARLGPHNQLPGTPIPSKGKDGAIRKLSAAQRRANREAQRAYELHPELGGSPEEPPALE